jgi:uncharacterized protein YeeX (DUF496 family)
MKENSLFIERIQDNSVFNKEVIRLAQKDIEISDLNQAISAQYLISKYETRIHSLEVENYNISNLNRELESKIKKIKSSKIYKIVFLILLPYRQFKKILKF